MRDNLIKAVKWYVISLFMEAGLWALFTADKLQSPRTLMTAVLCFGAVYVLSLFWQKMNKKLLLTSLILFIVTAFACQPQYIPLYFYVFTGTAVEMNFYLLWALVLLVVGIPVMAVAFKKLD